MAKNPFDRPGIDINSDEFFKMVSKVMINKHNDETKISIYWRVNNGSNRQSYIIFFSVATCLYSRCVCRIKLAN